MESNTTKRKETDFLSQETCSITKKQNEKTLLLLILTNLIINFYLLCYYFGLYSIHCATLQSYGASFQILICRICSIF